jgi:enhancing lycopene biosynthesis protein 2
MKKVAVVLSGCGFLDGAEITEAISTLIALSEAGTQTVCFAPNEDFEATAHHGETKHPEKRNAMIESARICRGKIHDIRELHEKDFDAVVFPGGYGAALNLSSWGREGAKARLNADVKRVITEFHEAAKPIGAMCIAPTLVAKVLGSEGVSVTIGDDEATAAEITKTGAQHVRCEVTDYVSDRDHKVLTTPAYMYGEAKPSDVFTGIRKMIRELVEMA